MTCTLPLICRSFPEYFSARSSTFFLCDESMSSRCFFPTSNVKVEDKSRILPYPSIEGDPTPPKSLGSSRLLVLPNLDESSNGSGTEFSLIDQRDTLSLAAAT